MPTQHFLEQAASDNADDPFLILLTISHADLPEPLKFVRNFTDIVSREETYTRFPFDFAPPGDGDTGATAARVIIDNVDQRIVQTVRALTSAPQLLAELIVASVPDAPEETYPLFKLQAVTGDRYTLSGDLVVSDDDAEPLTRFTYTPSLAPALFR
ncbi:MAG: DUF1833 family protein [Alphaproteobacteria bacterium]